MLAKNKGDETFKKIAGTSITAFGACSIVSWYYGNYNVSIGCFIALILIYASYKIIDKYITN